MCCCRSNEHSGVSNESNHLWVPRTVIHVAFRKRSAGCVPKGASRIPRDGVCFPREAGISSRICRALLSQAALLCFRRALVFLTDHLRSRRIAGVHK